MPEPRRADADVMLRVMGLNVYYGRSHALQGVDLALGHGVLSVVGRNGMGKTTLCRAIMGLTRASSGSIRVRGEEMLGLPPAQVARHGVGYVPQGRRLWRSLTVDEHLRMTAARQSGPWTVERVYDAFPRLAERKNNSGAQLSGGEQQMLAISRALVTNPRLLIMDEPTEGLAPVIVSQVEEMLVRLGEESDMAILVIEQNIGVATTVSENVAIMVNGRFNRIIEFAPARRRPGPAAAALGRRAPLRGRARARRGKRARSRSRSRKRREAGRGADQDLCLEPTRIASEREVRQKEIERTRTVEEIEIAAHEGIERARIANQRSVDTARIASEREVRQTEIERARAVEEAEIEAREVVEKARILQERVVTELRIVNEEETRWREIERTRVVEEAEIAAREATEKLRIA